MHSYLGLSYIIKRLIIGSLGLFALLLFVTDITWDDGVGHLHDFAVPLIVAVGVNIFLPKIGRENLITPLGLIMLFFFLGAEQGATLHTFMMGSSSMILLLNSIRPWHT
ncbi:MAG: hypothetical protein U9N59_04340 [Campylobacterota bacterium]|nr:hypothetical protein [Campylobacterota bacterium]